MKINLTEKQLFDIEWSILIAVDTVQQQYIKQKKFQIHHLQKNFINYTITYEKQEKEYEK